MKLALIQLDIRWEDRNANLVRAEDFVAKAAEDGCEIIVFPEMFNSGFSMNLDKVLEASDGPAFQRLSELAVKHNICIVAGYAEAAGDKGKNVAVVIDRNGQVLTKYTKCHPFSFADEDKYYEPGSEPVVFDLNGVPASIFICYDLRFPEIFRKVAKEVEVIFVIANWPASRESHWTALLKARAIENQCFVVGVNRIGEDGKGISYGGCSLVFNPLGEEICRGREDEEYLTVELEPKDVQNVRERFPFLKDMRMEEF